MLSTIATVAYFPFCYFDLINVVISFIYALFGFQIKHIEPDLEHAALPEQVVL